MTSINGLFTKPRDAEALYVLAHGAGAGMRHSFMTEISELLAERKIATFRYEFPYMAAGKRRPDTPRILQETVRAAVEMAREKAGGLPLIAGGKSMGGRMTSLAQSSDPLPDVAGLAFVGFPLHAPGRVGDKRADHLSAVDVPMLFVQGTRDSLADIDHIDAVAKRLKKRATLHIIDGGDHSFKVLKKLGREQSEVMGEIATAVAIWVGEVIQ